MSKVKVQKSKIADSIKSPYFGVLTCANLVISLPHKHERNFYLLIPREEILGTLGTPGVCVPVHPVGRQWAGSGLRKTTFNSRAVLGWGSGWGRSLIGQTISWGQWLIFLQFSDS